MAQPTPVKILAFGVLPIGILAIGIGCAGLMMTFRPSAAKEEVTEVTLPVEVLVVQPHEEPAVVRATGTVTAAREVNVVPEVGGRITWISPKLQGTARFDQGEAIARIDSRDYQAAVEAEEARLEQARLELALEEGRQAVAEKEWKMLGDGRSPEEGNLALRKPHLSLAKQNVEAAAASLDRAKNNLARTTLRAPFNAAVVTESLDVGQVVGPGGVVARLVGTDEVWVTVSVPVEQLAVVREPGPNAAGSQATVTQHLGDVRIERSGHVQRIGAVLDPQTRTATLTVAIPDPYREEDTLRPGAFVEVQIGGAPLSDVVRIPRSASIDGRSVWVADTDDRLQQRAIEVGWIDGDSLLIRDGLGAGDRVVVTPMSFPIPGTRLETTEVEASDV